MARLQKKYEEMKLQVTALTKIVVKQEGDIQHYQKELGRTNVSGNFHRVAEPLPRNVAEALAQELKEVVLEKLAVVIAPEIFKGLSQSYLRIPRDAPELMGRFAVSSEVSSSAPIYMVEVEVPHHTYRHQIYLPMGAFGGHEPYPPAPSNTRSKREIRMRRSLYPKWVRSEKMDEVVASRQLDTMEAVLATLEKLEKQK